MTRPSNPKLTVQNTSEVPEILMSIEDFLNIKKEIDTIPVLRELLLLALPLIGGEELSDEHAEQITSFVDGMATSNPMTTVRGTELKAMAENFQMVVDLHKTLQVAAMSVRGEIPLHDDKLGHMLRDFVVTPQQIERAESRRG